MVWHAELRTEAFGELEEERGAVRRRLRLSTPASSGRDSVDVLIHNLSLTGFLIETDTDIALGDTIEVDMPEAGPTMAEVVWKDGSFHGCEFDRPISLGAVSAALLRSPNDEAAAPAPAQWGLSPAAKAAIIVGTTLALWGIVFVAIRSL